MGRFWNVLLEHGNLKELVDKVRPSQIVVGGRDRQKFFLVISALKSHHFLIFELPDKEGVEIHLQ